MKPWNPKTLVAIVRSAVEDETKKWRKHLVGREGNKIKFAVVRVGYAEGDTPPLSSDAMQSGETMIYYHAESGGEANSIIVGKAWEKAVEVLTEEMRDSEKV